MESILHHNYTKYIIQGHTGAILDGRAAPAPHDLLCIGHTAAVPPWKDPAVHLHRESEEYYLLLQGGLDLWVAGACLSLKPMELLMVRPGIPHAVCGGSGRIEHFGFRAPCRNDKVITGEIPSGFEKDGPLEQELSAAWGCRIPLSETRNQNCWLVGMGQARFMSNHLILASLNFQTEEAANAGIGTRLRLHYHARSWEYYLALQGEKVLQIEDDLVHVEAGTLLEVKPGICHNIHSRAAPYTGITFRVPLFHESDKVEL